MAGFSTNPAAAADFPALATAVQSGQSLTPELVRKTIFAAGNEGLTFNWMPLLFAKLLLGRVLMVLFFVALFFAAFTSLISMIELGGRVLRDMGLPRERAVRIVMQRHRALIPSASQHAGTGRVTGHAVSSSDPRAIAIASL